VRINSSEGVRVNKLKEDRTLVISLKGSIEGCVEEGFEQESASAGLESKSRRST
jgi:hypothetical protein